MKQNNKDYILKRFMIALWNNYLALELKLNAKNNTSYCMKCIGYCDINNIDLSHIQKRSRRPDLKYAIDNIQLLCRNCHTQQEKISEDCRPPLFKKYIQEYKEVIQI